MKKFTSILILSLIVTFTFKTSYAMEKKKVEQIPVLMYSMKSTLATIATDPGNIPMEIMQKAEVLGLEVTGPQIWQYRNVDGNLNSTIDVDICIPVKAAKGDPGKFKFDVLPEITCISEIHKGAYSELTNTYNRIFGEMSRKGIMMGTSSREVYTVCDFENQANCITEVQVIITE